MRAEDHEAVRLTAAPKGIAAADLTHDQQEQLRALLDVYIARIPANLAEREAAKFAGAKLDNVHFAWAGGVERGQRTTTGCRARGCSPSTTTPSATSITSTRSGATRRTTSGSTSSAAT